jgi:hypothetical protein
MKRALLIDNEPLTGDLVTDVFAGRLGAETLCPARGRARKTAGARFARAVFAVSLPQISGIELAIFAADANIPCCWSRVIPGRTRGSGASATPFSKNPLV